jgi:hypothetical protein
MLPQSSILILIAILPERGDELRRLLDGLNRLPGLPIQRTRWCRLASSSGSILRGL